MPGATLIEIHAHGIPGSGGADSSFLALSPGAGGRYALTADQVRARRLVAAPVVLLSACRAALTPAHHHQARNLATAFLDAGARAVIASSEPVRDDHAEAFFGGVRDAIARGVAPAIALRDQRIAAGQESDHGWSDQVVAIE
jgi:CHAT domain-containing protein